MRVVVSFLLLLSVFVTAFGSPTVGATGTENDNSPKKTKITLCHATGSEKNPFVEITISYNGLHGHEDHEDDIIPAPANGCPEGEKEPTPTVEPTSPPASPTAAPTSTKPPIGNPPPTATGVPTSAPTSPPTAVATSTAVPTSTSAPTSAPATPSPVASATSSATAVVSPTATTAVPAPPTATGVPASAPQAAPPVVTMPNPASQATPTPQRGRVRRDDDNGRDRNGRTPNARNHCDRHPTDIDPERPGFYCYGMPVEPRPAVVEEAAAPRSTPEVETDERSVVGEETPSDSPAPVVEETVVVPSADGASDVVGADAPQDDVQLPSPDVLPTPDGVVVPVQIPAKGARQDVSAPAQIRGNGKGAE